MPVPELETNLSANGSSEPVHRAIRACRRCTERKVKCDGDIPCCGPCKKIRYSECDMIAHIMYTYQHVQHLQERIKWLEGLVGATYEDGHLVSGISAGATLLPRHKAESYDAGEPLVEEVGLLSLQGFGSYVGSMSGVTLTRLVSSSIRLYGHEVPTVSIDHEPPGTSRLTTGAVFPPKDIAIPYVQNYLSRVHRWYPFLDLEALSSGLSDIYGQRPQNHRLSSFTLLMVFALGCRPCSDPYTSEDYFVTACGFLSDVLASETLDTVRVLLLLCVYGLRSWRQPGKYTVNVWLLIGHALRMSVGLGISRNKYSYGEEENEMRRKVWWSVYAVERYVATGLSRVMGIRNTAIDAHFPRAGHETTPESLSGFMGHAVTYSLEPAKTLWRQRSLLGDIQETIYVALPRDGPPTLTVEQILPRIYDIQNRLVTLASEVQHLGSYDPVEQAVLHLAFHQATLLLHRPSPTMPTPSPEALDLSLGAARQVIQICGRSMEEGTIDVVMPGWNGFYDVFISGLTLVYCTLIASQCPNAIRDPNSDPDLLLSHSILQRYQQRQSSVSRYCELYTRTIDRLVQCFHSKAAPELDRQDALQVAADSGLTLVEGLDLDQDVVEYIASLLIGTGDSRIVQ